MEKITAAKPASIPIRSSQTRIWNRFEEQRKSTTKLRPRSLHWVVFAALPLALTFAASSLVLLPGSLPQQARLALFAF